MTLYTWRGDVWESRFDTICVMTNMQVKRNGAAVMGAGIAKQADDYSGGSASRRLGSCLSLHPGHGVYLLGEYLIHKRLRGLISFATKHHWRDRADDALIRSSARKLATLIKSRVVALPVALPKPGCGLGGLRWSDVEKLLLEEFSKDVRQGIVVVDR